MSHSLRLMLVMPVFATALQGCVVDDFSEDVFFTLVEIADSDSHTPINGARVSVSAMPRTVSVEPSRQPIPLAPTGIDGLTLIPVTTRRTSLPNGYEGRWELRIRFEDRFEVLEVSNTIGAMAVGEQYAVRVLETRSAPPPVPVVVATRGTNPPVLEVNGYVGDIWVCDNVADEYLWRVRALERYPYVTSITVGEFPGGFITAYDGSVRCLVGHADPPPGALQRTVAIYDPASQDFQFHGYCVDQDGAVTGCGPP